MCRALESVVSALCPSLFCPLAPFSVLPFLLGFLRPSVLCSVACALGASPVGDGLPWSGGGGDDSWRLSIFIYEYSRFLYRCISLSCLSDTNLYFLCYISLSVFLCMRLSRFTNYSKNKYMSIYSLSIYLYIDDISAFMFLDIELVLYLDICIYKYVYFFCSLFYLHIPFSFFRSIASE